MLFHSLPLDAALGKILGHNIARRDGTRLMRKGKPLGEAEIALLRAEGRDSVVVAELAPDDIGEDAAARAVAAAVCGRGLRNVGAAGGRVNLLAEGHGVLRVDAARVHAINAIEGITLATLAAHAPAQPRQIAATIKIIPFAVPAGALAQAQTIASAGPLVWLDVLPARRVTLVLSGSAGAEARIVTDFEAAIRARLDARGSALTKVIYAPLEDEHDEARLAEVLAASAARGDGLVILAGETAIMDRHDLAPRALERAGGRVAIYGAPVDPGNLLMVGYIGDMPVMGAPGCVRSPKQNVVDMVLPRLLAGDALTQADVAGLGVGGLLEEIPERGMRRR